MLAPIGILLLALVAIFFGRSIEESELLYYDADFEALYDEGIDEEGALPEKVKPVVAANAGSVPGTKKVETTAREADIDPAAIAQDIYDSTVL